MVVSRKLLYPFTEMYFIVCGDLYQLPSVRGIPVYNSITSENKFANFPFIVQV